MMEQVLKEVREAEQKAEDITAKANKEKERIIQDAIHKSLKLFNEKKLELENKNKLELEKKKEELEKEKAAVIEKGKKEAELLEKKAKKNFQRAVDCILNKFEEAINA